ncbi:GNAT family N-acetyltransferase [Microbacterium saperdae]|uniref:Phosphinothricin acetyltransferase n=1 Tax=Microbacterium saperdae TaxID=69368 RepID=A0A543BL27_9MICO|nr:GNAT family N-acetyltransferase [Microbacterium saperdae]TQL85535.1 phosphinothricin acetyltransferase [Microbacterium saperdae]GGM63046.1 N-acetyltransferase [Microbacterium saperdae]
MSHIVIRPMIPADWPDVERIYAEGIATGHATFEAEPPSREAFDTGKVPVPRLVAADDAGAVIGWAAASLVSARRVYCGVVEHSIYVADTARGRGVGGRLLTAFIDAADQAGIWTIQSSLFPENTASLRLHHQHGFRTVGTRERIVLMTYGPLAGTWRDTVLIERRRTT